MNIAVVFSGHYRSFEYLSDFFKQVYKGCDFYFCFWDHDYRYINVSEKASLQHRMDNYYKEDLDIESVSEFINREFHTTPLFVSSKQYLEFADTLTNASFNNYNDKLNRYAPLFLKYKAQSLLEREYDVVFRQRPDIYQPFPKPLHKVAQEVVNRSDYTIWTPRVHIRRGYPHVDDTFFYGSHSSMNKLLTNLTYNLNKLLDNELIKQGESKSFYFHRVLGALLMQTKADDVIQVPEFKNFIVRYRDVVNNTYLLR